MQILMLKGLPAFCIENPLYGIIISMGYVKDLSGNKYNYLKVIERANDRFSPSGARRYYWLCKCDCGVVKEIEASALKSSKIKSCGCRSKDWHKLHSGDKNPNWKGGRIVDSFGYVLLYMPSHPRAKSNGYVREHIVVMESKIGRALLSGENVHHKNGVRSDNRESNLELWVTSQPSGKRVGDLLDYAKEIMNRYG